MEVERRHAPLSKGTDGGAVAFGEIHEHGNHPRISTASASSNATGRPGSASWATNLAIAVVVGLLVALLGARDVLLVQAPITLLASAAGVWLFYVQHQFEHTYWAWDTDWSLHTSALYGSSHYDLPPVLRWFTAKIGIHHVDHLCSRIPYYRLGEVLRAHPELRAVSRLTLMRSVA